METPVCFLGSECGNQLYIKREDLYPAVMGGNKARIAAAYFALIDAEGYDGVVTYGGRSSNLCRAVAAMASQRGLPCVTVMHDQAPPYSCNEKLASLSGARRVIVAPSQVHDAIENELLSLRRRGLRPLFIPGGGQGPVGTQSYVNCYEEIAAYERRSGCDFDYLFLPTGTGTTQSGLEAGRLLHGGMESIVGFSVARTVERCQNVIRENIEEYFASKGNAPYAFPLAYDAIVEDGSAGGYGKGDFAPLIARCWKRYGIALDGVYTAKAFAGMEAYLKARGITGKKILFLHTGAAPLFFDVLADAAAEEQEGSDFV